jgi:hypothetical protein
VGQYYNEKKEKWGRKKSVYRVVIENIPNGEKFTTLGYLSSINPK